VAESSSWFPGGGGSASRRFPVAAGGREEGERKIRLVLSSFFLYRGRGEPTWGPTDLLPTYKVVVTSKPA
jgi:hypothetical protein